MYKSMCGCACDCEGDCECDKTNKKNDNTESTLELNIDSSASKLEQICDKIFDLFCVYKFAIVACIVAAEMLLFATC